MVASSASPASLAAVLDLQYFQATKQQHLPQRDMDEPRVGHACKAQTSNAKYRRPKDKEAKDIVGPYENIASDAVVVEEELEDNEAEVAEAPTSEPSIWPSGGTKSKKPFALCVSAASILMGLLHGARMARYDPLRPAQGLATFLHEWDADCDASLHRLVSYVNCTLHWRHVAWVGGRAVRARTTFICRCRLCWLPKNTAVDIRRPPGHRGTMVIDAPGRSIGKTNGTIEDHARSRVRSWAPDSQESISAGAGSLRQTIPRRLS